MLTVNEIIDFFKLNASHAKKELGQNFLINQKVVDKIIDELNIDEKDIVLEIGPGLGALTDTLVKKTEHLTVVEYDSKFVDFLNKSYADKGVTVVKNNIVKFKDFSATKVSGNLPYYMTTEIVSFVTLEFERLEKAVFMVQKECFKRFTALKGKDYNAINVVLDYLFEVKEVTTVSKENFFPQPTVESIVFSLTKKDARDMKFVKLLFKIAKICFSNRRKTIINNLSCVIKEKETLINILKNMGLSLTSRAEELSVNDFVTLTTSLLNNNLINL